MQIAHRSIQETAARNDFSGDSLRSCRDEVDRSSNFEIQDTLVCVIDRDNSIHSSVRELLASKNYLIEYFSSVEKYLMRRPHQGPCCLIVGVEASDLTGFSLQETLCEAGRSEQFVFISGSSEIRLCGQALKAGAIDYLGKSLCNDELSSAVERAIQSSKTLLRQNLWCKKSQRLLEKLTPREGQVLLGVISGRMNKEIAADLGAKEKTIKIHRGNVMKKLQVRSLVELIHFSIQVGISPIASNPFMSSDVNEVVNFNNSKPQPALNPKGRPRTKVLYTEKNSHHITLAIK